MCQTMESGPAAGNQETPLVTLYVLFRRTLVWSSSDGPEWDEFDYAIKEINVCMITDIPEGHVVRRIYVRNAPVGEFVTVVQAQETTLYHDVYRTALWKTRILRVSENGYQAVEHKASEESARLLTEHTEGRCSIEDIELAK